MTNIKLNLLHSAASKELECYLEELDEKKKEIGQLKLLLNRKEIDELNILIDECKEFYEKQLDNNMIRNKKEEINQKFEEIQASGDIITEIMCFLINPLLLLYKNYPLILPIFILGIILINMIACIITTNYTTYTFGDYSKSSWNCTYFLYQIIDFCWGFYKGRKLWKKTNKSLKSLNELEKKLKKSPEKSPLYRRLEEK